MGQPKPRGPWLLGQCPPQPAGRQSVSEVEMAPPGVPELNRLKGWGKKSEEQGRVSVSPAGALLAARHDLEVLQGTASGLTTGCLPGRCRAMTHGRRLCGQLHQALAEPAQAQFLWRPKERAEAGWAGRQHRDGCIHIIIVPSPTPFRPVCTCSGSVPTIPRPPN